MSIRIKQQLALLSLIEDEQYVELQSLTPNSIYLRVNVQEGSDIFNQILNLIAAYMNLRFRADARPFVVYLNGRIV